MENTIKEIEALSVVEPEVIRNRVAIMAERDEYVKRSAKGRLLMLACLLVATVSLGVAVWAFIPTGEISLELGLLLAAILSGSAGFACVGGYESAENRKKAGERELHFAVAPFTLALHEQVTYHNHLVSILKQEAQWAMHDETPAVVFAESHRLVMESLRDNKKRLDSLAARYETLKDLPEQVVLGSSGFADVDETFGVELSARLELGVTPSFMPIRAVTTQQ